MSATSWTMNESTSWICSIDRFILTTASPNVSLNADKGSISLWRPVYLFMQMVQPEIEKHGHFVMDL